jgi:hypothetical protein
MLQVLKPQIVVADASKQSRTVKKQASEQQINYPLRIPKRKVPSAINFKMPKSGNGSSA